MKQRNYTKKFIKWFKLTTEINPVLRWFRQKGTQYSHFLCDGRRGLYVLPSVKEVVKPRKIIEFIGDRKLRSCSQCRCSTCFQQQSDSILESLKRS